MNGEPRDRRYFIRLSAAALGGLLAGGALGRADEKKDARSKKNPDLPLLLQEPHVCRGLNTCKGKGKSGQNDCAGTSACATAERQTCGSENDCAGLGGCSENPGENSCRFRGEGPVPLAKDVWAKARKRFEEEMTKACRKFGPAPQKSR